jgi:gamma-glutamyltranspeptidase/glutathione hydrolase
MWSFFVLWLISSCALAQEVPGRAAIASAHPEATKAGMQILESGGNAFDAAVAVSAVLAVVEPQSSGFGGGGFWLMHRASDGKQVMIDGRERAPLAAHRDMYLDKEGEVVKDSSKNGALAAGIPGQPAALVHLSEHYGQLPLKKTLAPAIRLAKDGFKVYQRYRYMAGLRMEQLNETETAGDIFLNDFDVPPLGHLVRQPDLAKTLEQMANHGFDGFYKGLVAARLVKGVREAGGIWTLADLAAYKVLERTPITGKYRGRTIVSVPPPSSGGLLLVEMLNMLATQDLGSFSETDFIHYVVEVMRRAYRDRAEYLGDADFVTVPNARLLDKGRAQKLASGIDLKRATQSSSLPAIPQLSQKQDKGLPKQGGADTTHFSIIDAEGNRVAATLSINYAFGSGFVVPGTGVLLNNEMDDFSIKPGVPNTWGLVGSEANAIAPGKRPLSSMSPSFVEGPDTIAILGTPGGSRIITMVLLGILEHMENKPVKDWVARPRFHHQYLPDLLTIEPGILSDEVKNGLAAKGHGFKVWSRNYGDMHAILWNKKTGELTAASDPRTEGLSLVSKRSH